MEKEKTHWENIYSQKADNEVSWFQEYPKTSIRLIEKYVLAKTSSIIDVGGGNSMLASELISRGYNNLSVLDISKNALEISKSRTPSANIEWIETSILDFNPDNNFQIWHDRAVFHFLTEDVNIEKYAAKAKNYIAINGILILATFSENGPKKCSNLDVKQYSESRFCEVFKPFFQLQECFEEVHKTPFNTEQSFIWAVFKKN